MKILTYISVILLLILGLTTKFYKVITSDIFYFISLSLILYFLSKKLKTNILSSKYLATTFVILSFFLFVLTFWSVTRLIPWECYTLCFFPLCLLVYPIFIFLYKTVSNVKDNISSKQFYVLFYLTIAVSIISQVYNQGGIDWYPTSYFSLEPVPFKSSHGDARAPFVCFLTNLFNLNLFIFFMPLLKKSKYTSYLYTIIALIDIIILIPVVKVLIF
jgi:hypothetical protein|tara:strand:+ start:216 stop:866 length:651 start_codon:yes stop_codon:yes gene_type:complete